MATTFKVEQDQLDMIAESLDLWPERVTAMQKWFAQNGPHCLDEKSTKLHVAQFLPNQSENPIQRRLFSNEEDFIDFIGHCPDATESPILIIAETNKDIFDLEGESNSSDSTPNGHDEISKPSISPISLKKICIHFRLHLMALDGIGKYPISRHQLVPYNQRAGEITQQIWTHDFTYCCPMSWLDEGGRQTIMHRTQFAISAYSKISTGGKPIFSLFLNLPGRWIDSTISQWSRTHLYKSSLIRPMFLEHLTIFSQALHKISSLAIYVAEFHAILAGDLRISVHLQNPRASVEPALKKNQYLADEVSRWRANLDTLKIILHNFQTLDLAKSRGQREQNSSEGNQSDQAEFWVKNLLDEIAICQGKLQDLLDRIKRMQTTILDVVAVRNSASLDANIGHMKRLGDVNHETNREITELGRQNRRDAISMKYLGEITMIFLPLTAVSAFFSMTFFTIDTTSPSILPFQSIRFIWSFGVVASVVSACTYSLWWYRHRGLVLEQKEHEKKIKEEESISEKATIEQVDSIIKARLEVFQRRDAAELAFKEARAAVKAGAADEASLKELEAREHEAWAELMIAKQAVADLE